jgi:oxygen-independent coproporphyrinogen-3 oxidase
MAGIYIHIPFCKSRCSYCDFHSSTDFSLKNRLINSICKELKIRREYLKNEAVKTIYFGGGTPSLLNEEDLSKIFDYINQNYDTKFCEEITLEANPDDLTDEYIKMLKKIGINRISIGIQSFDDSELKLINRRHSTEKAISAVKKCQENGLNNISIDLMYGFPSQTQESWINSLKKAVELDVRHISAYHLTYEDGTVLHQKLMRGEIAEIAEDESVSMFKLLTETLEQNGFEQYEISNFAKPNFRSKHNSSYWNDEIYIGVGASAHSYDFDSRQWNIANTQKYISAIENDDIFFEQEILTKEEKYNDYIITRLRTKEGIDLEELNIKFGNTLFNYCLNNAEKFILQQKLEIKKNFLTLTKAGIFISDSIFSDLIY